MKMVERIEQWPVDRLVPYDRNARTHSEAQIGQIAQSIAQFGFNNPVLIDSSSGIIAGHGRYQAARKLKLATVPVIVLDHLTDAQRRAYIIADNKLALNAGWDEELLAAELRDLDEMIDLQLTGFDANELERMLATDDDGRADECPEAPETPVTRRGDLWVLGRHRVLCGDSRTDSDVVRLMNGCKAKLIATDPPYLVDYDGLNHPSKWGKDRPSKNKYWSAMYGVHWDESGNDLSLWSDVFRVAAEYATEDNAAWYVWHADKLSSELKAILSSVGLLCHQVLIWKKNRPVLTRSWYMQAHEACIYGWIKGNKPPLVSKEQATTVWELSHDDNKVGSVHPTQKPVELFGIAIRMHTTRGDVIYEPFSGSGSQCIAAEMLGRSCYGMEIEPRYVDVIVTRWQEYTGGAATLDADGRTFAAIAEERLVCR